MEYADKEWVREYAESNFVKKEDCNETQTDNAKKFANDDTRLKLFEQKIGLWDKLFWIIASATFGQLVLSVFNSIRG